MKNTHFLRFLFVISKITINFATEMEACYSVLRLVFLSNKRLFKTLFIMNKTELIAAIAAKAGISKVAATDALNAATAAITEALAKGENVQLIGFGTFAVKETPAREGINPATKAKIQIAAKKVAKFKAGAALNAAL